MGPEKLMRVPSLLSEPKNRAVLVIGLDNAGKTSILCHLANVAATNKHIVKSVATAPTVGTQMVEFRRRNLRWVAWDMSGQDSRFVGSAFDVDLAFADYWLTIGLENFEMKRNVILAKAGLRARAYVGRSADDIETSGLHTHHMCTAWYLSSMSLIARESLWLGTSSAEFWRREESRPALKLWHDESSMPLLLSYTALRFGDTPVAILCNKYDALTESPPGAARNDGGCLTVDNVCVALAIETLQVHRQARAFATSALTGEGIEEAWDWITFYAKNK